MSVPHQRRLSIWTPIAPGVTVGAMNKRNQDQLDAQASRASRQSRVHALLFAGAALGTTVLTLGAIMGPKLPPFTGE
jgi:hypothetical protein